MQIIIIAHRLVHIWNNLYLNYLSLSYKYFSMNRISLFMRFGAHSGFSSSPHTWNDSIHTIKLKCLQPIQKLAYSPHFLSQISSPKYIHKYIYIFYYQWQNIYSLPLITYYSRMSPYNNARHTNTHTTNYAYSIMKYKTLITITNRIFDLQSQNILISKKQERSKDFPDHSLQKLLIQQSLINTVNPETKNASISKLIYWTISI